MIKTSCHIHLVVASYRGNDASCNETGCHGIAGGEGWWDQGWLIDDMFPSVYGLRELMWVTSSIMAGDGFSLGVDLGICLNEFGIFIINDTLLHCS